MLGFTDAYFLYAVGYVPLRLASLDPFTAFMLVMAALSVIGFFGFMRLAITDFGVSAASAAVGAFLFAFGNMMAVKMGHAQSYCAMLLPLVAHLTATAFKAEHKRAAIIAAAAAGSLQALIFLTAYFTGWFATLFGIVVLLIFAALRGARHQRWLGTCRDDQAPCARRLDRRIRGRDRAVYDRLRTGLVAGKLAGFQRDR